MKDISPGDILGWDLNSGGRFVVLVISVFEGAERFEGTVIYTDSPYSVGHISKDWVFSSKWYHF